MSFLNFLCLLKVSNPTVHLQEDGFICSYGMERFTCLNYKKGFYKMCKYKIFELLDVSMLTYNTVVKSMIHNGPRKSSPPSVLHCKSLC
jgi:hypothetical protein